MDSPAIDHAFPTIYDPAEDQRGSGRLPGSSTNDLGAIEVPEPGFAAGLLGGLIVLAHLKGRRARAESARG